VDWPSELVIVRHAHTEGDTLTDRGRKQAELTGAYLRERYPEGFDWCFTAGDKTPQETLNAMLPEQMFVEDSRLVGGQAMEVDRRIHVFAEDLTRVCEGKRVLVVAGHFWQLLFRRRLDEATLSIAIRQFLNDKIEHASVTVYHRGTRNGRSRLIRRDSNVVPWRDRI
jgi:broad specificity phosphatase PhoE